MTLYHVTFKMFSKLSLVCQKATKVEQPVSNKRAVLSKWSATLVYYFSAVMKLLIIGSQPFLGGKIVGKSQIHSLSLKALMLLFSLRKLKYNSRLLFFKVWTENIKYGSIVTQELCQRYWWRIQILQNTMLIFEKYWMF